jgi:hypothetical protein
MSSVGYPLSHGSQVLGACFEDRDRVGEECVRLSRGRGQPCDAWRPRPQFHAALEVDGPDDHVAAGGKIAHHDVETTALARPGGSAE